MRLDSIGGVAEPEALGVVAPRVDDDVGAGYVDAQVSCPLDPQLLVEHDVEAVLPSLDEGGEAQRRANHSSRLRGPARAVKAGEGMEVVEDQFPDVGSASQLALDEGLDLLDRNHLGSQQEAAVGIVTTAARLLRARLGDLESDWDRLLVWILEGSQQSKREVVTKLSQTAIGVRLAPAVDHPRLILGVDMHGPGVTATGEEGGDRWPRRHIQDVGVDQVLLGQEVPHRNPQPPHEFMPEPLLLRLPNRFLGELAPAGDPICRRIVGDRDRNATRRTWKQRRVGPRLAAIEEPPVVLFLETLDQLLKRGKGRHRAEFEGR